jgi:hypothetical protein
MDRDNHRWEIEQKEEITRIKVIHIGLNPEVECYEICAGDGCSLSIA